jgi:cell division protein FtsW (lipid II flippase)
MVSGEDLPRRRRWPPWAAAGALTLLTLGSAMLYEFACAVGEYEENNHTCDAAIYPLIGFGVLMLGLATARLTNRKEPRWLGYAAALILFVVGWNYA